MFIKNIIIGIIIAMTRLTNNWLSVRSVLATSKRFFSKFSVPKARMTIIPLRLSRVTKFSLSTSFCMILNFGITNVKTTIISPIIAMTPTAIIQLSEMLFRSAMTIPPMPKMGAKQRNLSPIMIIFCTCVISFVVRVMREAVEKISNSAAEKLSTLAKTSRLVLRETPAEILAAKYPAPIIAITPNNDRSSIIPPVLIIYQV